jgi:hypothetical protein
MRIKYNMFSNEAGTISLCGNILQLRITDGDCEEDVFREILGVIQKVFRETDVPLRLILNSLDEEIRSDVISQLVEFLDSRSLNTENLLGTAVILSSVQYTFSKILIDTLKFTKPVGVFCSEIEAAEFVASL